MDIRLERQLRKHQNQFLQAELQTKSPLQGDVERKITQRKALRDEPTNVEIVLLLILWLFKTTVDNLLLFSVLGLISPLTIYQGIVYTT